MSTFAADPGTPADRALVVWCPDWLASAIRLIAATGREPAVVRWAPERWPGWTLGPLRARDGWHLVCRIGGATHRLWWPERELPTAGTPLGFSCDLDAYADASTAAALRFWRAMAGAGHARAPPRHLEKPAAPRIMRRIAILRALDGWLAGASYRALAEGLLGPKALPASAWKTSSRRGQVIRLVATGRRLMNGGYRDLLKPPRRRFARVPYPAG